MFAESKGCDFDGGKNIDGVRVHVFVQKDEGMVIKTCHSAKPNFWECVEFDADGYKVGVSYEPFDENKPKHEAIDGLEVDT
jgi:hypothetical protein